MPKMNWMSALALLLPAALQASTLGNALPCTSATLADYIALGSAGCSVGPLALRNFSFTLVSSTGSPTTVDPTEIFVAPLPTTNGYGLSYSSSGFDVTAGQSVIYQLDYTIDPGPPIIRGLNLNLDTDPVFPASASITEDACVGAEFIDGCLSPGTPLTLSVFDNGISSTLTDDADFAGVSIVGIETTIDLDASQGGSANFSNFSSQATASPEPASGSLAIPGLLLVSALAWGRLAKSRS